MNMRKQVFELIYYPCIINKNTKQFFHFMEKLLQTDISHGDYESYVPMLDEKFANIEIKLKKYINGGLPTYASLSQSHI